MGHQPGHGGETGVTRQASHGGLEKTLLGFRKGLTRCLPLTMARVSRMVRGTMRLERREILLILLWPLVALLFVL